MKRTKIIMAILLVAIFAVFALGSGESGTDNQGGGSADVNKNEQCNLGKYHVTIDSCRLAEDYEGKPVVIVKYIFKNVADDNATAFFLAISDHVYQNGIGLNEAYFLADNVDYNGYNYSKEIKKGASIEVEIAYELNDTTTDIEVEVEEVFSFDNKLVKKTFKISG